MSGLSGKLNIKLNFALHLLSIIKKKKNEALRLVCCSIFWRLKQILGIPFELCGSSTKFGKEIYFFNYNMSKINGRNTLSVSSGEDIQFQLAR